MIDSQVPEKIRYTYKGSTLTHVNGIPAQLYYFMWYYPQPVRRPLLGRILY